MTTNYCNTKEVISVLCCGDSVIEMHSRDIHFFLCYRNLLSLYLFQYFLLVNYILVDFYSRLKFLIFLILVSVFFNRTGDQST